MVGWKRDGDMEWENNYFRIIGGDHSLKLIQKAGGVVVIPQYLERFLIIKIRRTDGNFYWEFPRGFTEADESYYSAVQRELKEKLNITAINIEKDLGEIMADSDVIESHVHIVTVKINSIDNIKVQRSEHIVDYTLIDFPTLCRMIKQNEIVDGFTIGGLFKWYLEMSF